MISQAQTRAAKALDTYYIDVEGGQATLFVSPSGESLLVDSGFPGERDTGRIMEAVKAAGLTQIDHLLSTHYHVDHIGNVQTLASMIPIRHFYDHGPTAEPDREQVQGFQKAYAEIHAKATHTVLKPGDKIPFAGVDWLVVSDQPHEPYLVLRTDIVYIEQKSRQRVHLIGRERPLTIERHGAIDVIPRRRRERRAKRQYSSPSSRAVRQRT